MSAVFSIFSRFFRRHGYFPLFCWLLGATTLLFQALQPVVLNNITNTLTVGEFQETRIQALYVLLGGYLVLTFGTFMIDVVQFIVSEYWKSRIIFADTMELYRRIVYTNPDFNQDNEPEKIVKRIERDVLLCVAFTVQCVMAIPMVVPGLVISAWLMFFGSSECFEWLGLTDQKGNALLATVIILMSPLQFFFLAFNRLFIKVESKQAEVVEKNYVTASETLRGMMDIRSVGAFPFALARIAEILRSVMKMRNRFQAMCVTFPVIDKAIVSLTEVVILGISAILIFRGKMTFADYMGFTILCTIFNSYIAQIVNVFLGWQMSIPARRRLTELRKLRLVFTPENGIPLKNGKNGWNVENLSYTYQDRQILDGVSLTISPGEHVAIIGPSGCGKTTLLKLMMRHLQPTEGRISFSEHEISRLQFDSLARCVAYVAQRPFMFKGTIRENILMGRKITISDAQWVEFLRDVAFLPDILEKGREEDVTLPEEGDSLEKAVQRGLDYEIVADNQGLSGGQMAKVALLRAIVGNPDVFLLDEVTASLDALSQETVLRTFQEKYADKTVVSVTHQLDGLAHFQRIVELTDGKVSADNVV